MSFSIIVVVTVIIITNTEKKTFIEFNFKDITNNVMICQYIPWRANDASRTAVCSWHARVPVTKSRLICSANWYLTKDQCKIKTETNSSVNNVLIKLQK